MADIVLICPKCGAKTTVSEYISDLSVPCPACGEAIPMPKKQKSSTVLKLKKIQAQEPPPAPVAPAAGESEPEEPVKERATIVTASLKRKSAMQESEDARVKTSAMLVAISWALFIILAGILGYFRFYGEVPGISKEAFIQYGLIAIGVSYLLIIILALHDNMFDGLLSIVVPMYPFYYILGISNQVIVRAIVAAILVGFGYDMAILLQDVWNDVFKKVNNMIRNA
jgi:DNA-directed RNA polymerase subunit RPC12/RpoP